MSPGGPKVAVIDYGIGNLRSAQKALQHVGADARLTADPAEIEAADGFVLPGVGAFGACVDALNRTELAPVAVAASQSGRPFLGICVGMQLMFEGSDESPDHAGLGIFPGRIRLLPDGVKRPQMQWNPLRVTDPTHPLFGPMDGAWVYFVHSYAAEATDALAASCDYGGPVTAAVSAGSVHATQFHPEKSAEPGLALLSRFCDLVGKGAK